MSAEKPHFSLYDTIVREAHEYAHRLGGDPEIIDRIVPGLVTSVLEAYVAGLSRKAIVQAIERGLQQGELQCADQSLTPDYWEDVRRDTEEHWERRYQGKE